MRFHERLTRVCCAGVLLGLIATAPAAQADPANQTTYFTFSQPVELPGKTLPAGKYTFKLADSLSNRHIVQVFNADGTQIYATILAIPAERRDPPDEPEIRFMETGASHPPAVKIWWYPGTTTGHEFVYPKDQALRLARMSRESVLATESPNREASAMSTAEVTRVEPGSDTTTVDGSQASRTADVATQAPVVRTRRARATNARADVDMLPKTASEAPVIGLIGLLALAGAISVRAFGRSLG